MPFFAIQDSTLLIIVSAIITALPPTIASIGMAVYQSKNISTQADKTNAKIDDNTNKTNSIDKKADIIHDLTNSNLTAIKEELASNKIELKASKDRIEKLESLLLDLSKKKVING